jgi:predicted transcriptional regulator
MIMYMLNRVNFPLSNTQIQTFMLEKQYTNYFTLQEVISSLVTDDYLSVVSYRNSTQYRLTAEGTETIGFFYTKIPAGIRDDIDEYIKSNKYELKCAVGTTANYYRNTNGDYTVHCQVKEGDATLIELNMSVPTQPLADKMCSSWKDASQDIYDFVIKKLM